MSTFVSNIVVLNVASYLYILLSYFQFPIEIADIKGLNKLLYSIPATYKLVIELRLPIGDNFNGL